MIVKQGKLYKVISHRTGRNMGTYLTKKEAVARLKQIKMFGRLK